MQTTVDAEHTRAASLAVPPGPVLFARYAFGPNRLGLCGPEDWRSLLEMGVAGAQHSSDGQRGADETAVGRRREIDRGLRDLAAGFEGAFPYLELIAHEHGIGDALDRRVVDAYWIGNALSDGVDAVAMARSMEARFERQLKVDEWRWLASKPAAGARPTHAFHVLEVFPRVGTARGEGGTDALALLDACRIRWGRVIEVSGEQLVVDVVPLHLQERKLVLGPEQRRSVRRWLDGTGFVDDVEPGDVVSVHWDWACEVLSPQRSRALQWRTLRSMEIANRTM